jgi:hypothetical protein
MEAADGCCPGKVPSQHLGSTTVRLPSAVSKAQTPLRPRPQLAGHEQQLCNTATGPRTPRTKAEHRPLRQKGSFGHWCWAETRAAQTSKQNTNILNKKKENSSFSKQKLEKN